MKKPIIKLRSTLIELHLKYIKLGHMASNQEKLNLKLEMDQLVQTLNAIKDDGIGADHLKDYLIHIKSHDRMFNHYRGIRREKTWVVNKHPKPIIMGDVFVTEQYYYLCMEIMEGKHNEFLKEIIKATESKEL